MKIRSIASLALGVALALPAAASADNSAKTPAAAPVKLADGDVKVIAHLHHVNQMEIDLGKAAQNSTSSGVKSFGDTLVKDHGASDQELTTFIKAHKLTAIPADKAETDADKADQKDMMAQVAKVKAMKGPEFDKAFLQMMATGHDKELAKIDTALASVVDADLKVMLTATKPVLQKHADTARDLQKTAQASNEEVKLPSTR